MGNTSDPPRQLEHFASICHYSALRAELPRTRGLRSRSHLIVPGEDHSPLGDASRRTRLCPSPKGRAAVALVSGVLAISGSLAAAPASAATTPTVTISGPVTTKAQRDWVNYVPAVAATIALLTALFILAQVRAARAASRRERAAGLAGVWSDREFKKWLAPTLGFLDCRTLSECIFKLMAWSQAPRAEARYLPAYFDPPHFTTKNDVVHILNALEEVGLQYNQNQADRSWITRMIPLQVIDILQLGLWFISFLRGDDPGAFSEWINAAQDMRRRSPRLRHLFRDTHSIWQRHKLLAELCTPKPDQKFRVLCVPSNARSASNEDWGRAFQLSCLLTDKGRQAYFLKKWAAHEGPSSAQSSWRATVIPKSIDPPHLTSERTGDASPLNSRLDGMSVADIDEVITRLTGIPDLAADGQQDDTDAIAALFRSGVKLPTGTYRLRSKVTLAAVE